MTHMSSSPVSLFATDANLLNDARSASVSPARSGAPRKNSPAIAATIPADASSVAPLPLADLWSQLLPALVDSALARGLVRTAAMLHETATEQPGVSPNAVSISRQRIDACAAVDAALQQRQLHGELAFVPSLSPASDGTARFMTGLCWDELAHPTVASFVDEELRDGAQAELRNFLEETLRDGAVLLDLEPGVGTAIASALTWPGGRVTARAWQPDRVLHALIARNATHAGCAARLDLQAHAASAAELHSRTMPTNAIIHIGSQAVAPFKAVLKLFAQRSAAIAWRADLETSDIQADALSALGYTPFVIGVRDGAMELVPWQDDDGATMAFALSRNYVNLLENAS